MTHVEREPTLALQLELARDTNTDDAWWAVLTYFPGREPENDIARQELMTRLVQQLRFSEANQLCEEVLTAKNAPESAVATAWACKALNLVLTGHLADAEQIDRQHLRDRGESIQRPLGEWLNEALRRPARPPSPQPEEGPRPRADRGPGRGADASPKQRPRS